jgi:hypothetical protein
MKAQNISDQTRKKGSSQEVRLSRLSSASDNCHFKKGFYTRKTSRSSTSSPINLPLRAASKASSQTQPPTVMSLGRAFTLASGRKIPALGLGTWQSKPGEVKAAVATALKVGYVRFPYVSAQGST